jgi:hypothetical protein
MELILWRGGRPENEVDSSFKKYHFMEHDSIPLNDFPPQHILKYLLCDYHGKLDTTGTRDTTLGSLGP